MALDNKDIELLEGAKEKGLTLEEVIESAKNIVRKNKELALLKENKIDSLNAIFYKAKTFIENNLEEISKIDKENQDLFILNGAKEIIKNEEKEIQYIGKETESENKE